MREEKRGWGGTKGKIMREEGKASEERNVK